MSGRFKGAVGVKLVCVVACAVTLAACGSSGGGGSGGGGSGGGGSGGGGTAGGSEAASTNSPVKIALLTLKVPGSDLLTPYTAGAQAALKVINGKGGFGGRHASLVTCNTMLQAATTSECAHKTIADHPVAAFGCEPSWSAAGQPIYTQAGVPSFMCGNTKQDFVNSLNNILQPGGVGMPGSMARYLCSLPQVKRVAFFTVDLPIYQLDAAHAGQILKGCGKTLVHFSFPATSTDVTPYVDKATAAKPDFVMLDPLAGPGVITIYKAFAQQGVPASHIIVIDTNLTWATLHAAGAAMNGTYGVEQSISWGDTSNPEVAAYQRAARSVGADPRDPNVVTGYLSVMFIYQAAKKIGFDHLTPGALAKFVNDKANNGFHIPMSRTLVVPGPSGFVQMRQPYSQVVQWRGGRLHVITKGTDHGWVNGF